MFDCFEDILLALRDLGRGESFWRSLAVYAGTSAVMAQIGLAIWKEQQ
jgi:hypothetical protein